ncbi:MAG: CBS domain-containing protein [Elusimicrobiota bacterium]|nr:CBS domain-containing protein [Elusimicrobiota bacterium]
MRAKDIMRRKVVTVERWLTLSELAKLFEEKGITGAPVVDEDGAILGVVSQTDLVRVRREASAGVALYHKELEEPLSELGIHFEEADAGRVESIMTPGAIAFDEEAPVEALAEAMLERHIHRVLITRGSKLAGIVTTMDLLKALMVLAKRESAAAR